MASFMDLEPASVALGDRQADCLENIVNAIVGTLLLILAPPLEPISIPLLESLVSAIAHLNGRLLGSFSLIPISKTIVNLIPSDIFKNMYVAGTISLTLPITLLGAINPLLGIILGIPLGIVLFVVTNLPINFIVGGLSDFGRFLIAIRS